MKIDSIYWKSGKMKIDSMYRKSSDDVKLLRFEDMKHGNLLQTSYDKVHK